MEDVKNEIDAELAAAQAALAAAQKRKGEAEAAALAKIRIQIAEQEAEAQRKLREENEARERKLEEIRKETARKAEQRRLEAAVARAQAEQLQRELSEREQAVKAEADRQEAIRKVQEQAFAVEQEAKRIEADLIRGKSAVNELALDQNRPSGIHDPRNPISRMFGTERVPENAFVAPVVEEAKQATLREVGFDEAGKLVDYILYQSGVRVDRTEAVNMLSRFPYETVENVFTQVMSEHKAQRMTGVEIAEQMQRLLSGRAQ
jgi:multidrug efflux pump subunit AcrA (membrane-fusion protein)